ncbi:MAG: glyoxalase [Paludibacteraceae bacterium]|nr:glyoxalase [Paludibacteraceae bacterium]
MISEDDIGRSVSLCTPERGYRYGTIIGFVEYQYAVELTSGYVVYVYSDEFTFDD